MNIFVTHHNPEVAAKFLCDKHVPKMLLESTQLLSNAIHHNGNPIHAPYKPTQTKHPCSLWTVGSQGNFIWLLHHAKAIAKEFNLRFRKHHACENHLAAIESQIPVMKFKRKSRTKFVLCMPKIYRTGDVITSYRSYVKDAKSFAKWQKGRKKPKWYYHHSIQFNPYEIASYMLEGIPTPSSIPQDLIDCSASIASARWFVAHEKANRM